MGFDDRAADREAHAHAIGLRRVEGFKETRQALRAQPGRAPGPRTHQADDASVARQWAGAGAPRSNCSLPPSKQSINEQYNDGPDHGAYETRALARLVPA